MSESPPNAIIVGGVNGAGKTSFARQMLPLLHAGVPFLNVDEIQRGSEAFRHPVAASREFFRCLAARVEAREQFAIETTLSSPNYTRHIKHWRERGYESVLHFIEVPSADFAVQRVAQRVKAGGHDIPEVDIRRRFQRSKELFETVYSPIVDRWYHWKSDERGLSLVNQNSERNP